MSEENNGTATVESQEDTITYIVEIAINDPYEGIPHELRGFDHDDNYNRKKKIAAKIKDIPAAPTVTLSVRTPYINHSNFSTRWIVRVTGTEPTLPETAGGLFQTVDRIIRNEPMPSDFAFRVEHRRAQDERRG